MSRLPEVGDTLTSSLWKQLVFAGYWSAAVGLLEDAFRVRVALVKERDEPAAQPEYNAEKQRGYDEAWARDSEDLMMMIGDADGSKLQAWSRLYVEDKTEFERLTRARVEACRLQNLEP